MRNAKDKNTFKLVLFGGFITFLIPTIIILFAICISVDRFDPVFIESYSRDEILSEDVIKYLDMAIDEKRALVYTFDLEDIDKVVKVKHSSDFCLPKGKSLILSLGKPFTKRQPWFHSPTGHTFIYVDPEWEDGECKNMVYLYYASSQYQIL